MVTIAAFPLLVVTLLFEPARSSGTPVQADLIFPRNNSVYQPAAPFPIVFAIHNFSTAWKFKPTVDWRLSSLDLVTGDKYNGGDGIIGWTQQTQPNWPSPPNTFVAANSSTVPGLSKEAVWTLEYALSIGADACSGSAARIQRGKVFFNTSNTKGIIPDLSTTASCAPSIGVISIEGFDPQNGSCILTSPQQPRPVACAITVDTPTAGQIARVMNQSTGSTTYCAATKTTWPNMTILGKGNGYDECPKKSESRINLLQNSSGLVVLLFLVTAFMWR